jgi:hypothetical protein
VYAAKTTSCAIYFVYIKLSVQLWRLTGCLLLIYLENLIVISPEAVAPRNRIPFLLTLCAMIQEARLFPSGGTPRNRVLFVLSLKAMVQTTLALFLSVFPPMTLRRLVLFILSASVVALETILRRIQNVYHFFLKDPNLKLRCVQLVSPSAP